MKFYCNLQMLKLSLGVYLLVNLLFWSLSFLLKPEGDIVKAYLIIVIICSIIIFPLLIIGLGRITFYEDKFIYKYSLFSRKSVMYYTNITALEIDYDNHPIGLKSAISKKIYVIEKGKIRYQIDISYNIIKEFLKHIDKTILGVSFYGIKSFPKKHRTLLYEYLKTEKQRRLVEESLKKSIEKSFVIKIDDSKKDITESILNLIEQNSDKSKYEVLFLIDSCIEGIEETAKRYLKESGVFYRVFYLKGKNYDKNTVINKYALSKNICNVAIKLS